MKGVHFNDLKDAGDIVELAKKYSVAGADELVFLDITASNDNRSTRLSWVERVATAVDVPFTVGGGIAREADVEALLKKGADKISVNSAVRTGFNRSVSLSFWETMYCCGYRCPI